MSDFTVEWSPHATTDRRLLALHAYWAGLCGDGALPWRRDFDPAAVTDLLPWIVLVDVLNDPRDFRFRLVGSAFAQAAGRDPAGLTAGEIFPAPYRTRVLEAWNRVADDCGPNWGRGATLQKERDFLSWQGLLLPLRTDDGKIGQLLGAAVFSVTSGV